MNKYNGLLSKVSQQYHIYKGKREPETDWKTRLVYSICGMMAYASLWDDSEGPVSIAHLKNRMRKAFVSYKSMYPELSGKLPIDSNELEDEIVNLFTNTGIVYHSPQRLVPSMKSEEQFNGILFQRGIALDSISSVSGLGFYSEQAGSSAKTDKIMAMFGLEQKHLQELWQTTVSAASWESCPFFELGTSYLRLTPPFNRGYWVDKPAADGIVSILQTGMKGSQLYYLYRCTGGKLEVSPLPQWQVEGYNYRTLACACLSACGKLPPIGYTLDGTLIHVHMNYLLPPRELCFLELYSWPARCSKLPCDFSRSLSAEVFAAIRMVLSDKGYEFKEEWPNAERSKFFS